MSQSDTIPMEYKTIRLEASAYYKLVELTGMVNIATGMNFSISQLATLLVQTSYDNAYPEFKKLINNPTLLKKTQQESQQGLKQALELIKDLKIVE